VLNAHNKLQIMLIKKYSCENEKLRHFGKNTAKTRHFGKITAFTAFDKNYGFRDFRDYLLSLIIIF